MNPPLPFHPATPDGTFGSSARVGQKTQLGRRWAKLGTRPVAALDQRTASTYIFGAICPLHGKAVGLILPPMAFHPLCGRNLCHLRPSATLRR